MERIENHLERNEPKLNIIFSLEEEVNRVEQTLKKYDWFKEKGYQVTFPNDFIPDAAAVENLDIESVVKKDFSPSVYEQKQVEIENLWGEMRGQFFEKMKSFGLMTQSGYDLYLTRYGVGGSYRLPNTIILNFNYPNYEKIERVVMIIFHEMIHLTIEKWIQDYNIPHWTKERLVDLIYNKIFEQKTNLQTDPENPEKIEHIFNNYFPDIKRVIVELSNKEQ